MSKEKKPKGHGEHTSMPRGELAAAVVHGLERDSGWVILKFSDVGPHGYSLERFTSQAILNSGRADEVIARMVLDLLMKIDPAKVIDIVAEIQAERIRES